jgi:ketosteroid isomerase-like protein
MSSGNVELVQKILGAYLSGDDETLRAMIGPDSEIYGAPGLLNSGTYQGYEGFREWITQWEEAWDEGVQYELGEMIEVGSSIVVIPTHIVARGAGSGVEIDSAFGWLFEFRDGHATRFHAYVGVDEALDAARSLSEAE